MTNEVVKSLANNGIKIVSSGGLPPGKNISGTSGNTGISVRSEVIDLSGYKTPVLTERHLRNLHELTGEIRVPLATITTPKAREILKRKNIAIKCV